MLRKDLKLEDNIFFELLNNPYLKNDSVISTRFIGKPGMVDKENLYQDSLYFFDFDDEEPEKLIKDNIDLLLGDILLKDKDLDTLRYLEISIRNDGKKALNFDFEYIDENHSDKFYVAFNNTTYETHLFVKTHFGVHNGLSRLIPSKATQLARPARNNNKLRIDYKEYKYLLQIYWYAMYSKFNINTCVPPPLHWKKNDKQFSYKGEFFKINLDISEVILFINLIEIFPFELAKILNQRFSAIELNSFSEFKKQIEILSTNNRQLDMVKGFAFEWLLRNRVHFEYEKYEIKPGNIYSFGLSDKGKKAFLDYRNFLYEGPFDYSLDRADAFMLNILGESHKGEGLEGLVNSPSAHWVEFNEDYLSIKSILK